MFDALRAQVQGADQGFPYIASPTLATEQGTPYLVRPGVNLIARPQVSLESLQPFLEGFDPALEFPGYLADPTPLPPGAQLCKLAGQLCYASFGAKRTYNADTAR